ncbi:MAG: hypothetical protein H0U66_11500 [Gemmatimonadaceae bacterium]|nr:hypothetical protein [Gemmatimonadaceae bacterium]
MTGLQLVVIALLTESRKKRTLEEVDAFATPTIVHFCAVVDRLDAQRAEGVP